MSRRFSLMAAYLRAATTRLFLTSVAGALFVLVSAGCGRTAPVPPAADFIVATTDSAYWVTAGREGVHVRGVPMTLVRLDGRFREVYVADLDLSYDAAIFAGERVYIRDLVSGDSSLVYEDQRVAKLAAQYGRENPGARHLSADDDSPEEPDFAAFGETDILDIHGSVLTIEHRSSIEQPGGTQSDTTHLAVDLRSASILRTRAMLDSAANDSNTVSALPRTWKRTGYELLARGDSGSKQMSLVLRDDSQQSWPLITVSTRSRLYWLDAPRIDNATRHALVRAFNGAASYDEAVKYVRHLVPRLIPSRTHRPIT